MGRVISALFIYLLITACGGGGGSGDGVAAEDVLDDAGERADLESDGSPNTSTVEQETKTLQQSDIEGLWDVTEVENGYENQGYVYIDESGLISTFDYQGDAYGVGLNCYATDGDIPKDQFVVDSEGDITWFAVAGEDPVLYTEMQTDVEVFERSQAIMVTTADHFDRDEDGNTWELKSDVFVSVTNLHPDDLQPICEGNYREEPFRRYTGVWDITDSLETESSFSAYMSFDINGDVHVNVGTPVGNGFSCLYRRHIARYRHTGGNTFVNYIKDENGKEINADTVMSVSNGGHMISIRAAGELSGPKVFDEISAELRFCSTTLPDPEPEPEPEDPVITLPPVTGGDSGNGGGGFDQYQCGTKKYCSDMVSCSEAKYFLQQCGVSRLDRDGDGVPCESICL